MLQLLERVIFFRLARQSDKTSSAGTEALDGISCRQNCMGLLPLGTARIKKFIEENLYNG
jgi:hypothetical protein